MQTRGVRRWEVGAAECGPRWAERAWKVPSRVWRASIPAKPAPKTKSSWKPASRHHAGEGQHRPKAYRWEQDHRPGELVRPEPGCGDPGRGAPQLMRRRHANGRGCHLRARAGSPSAHPRGPLRPPTPCTQPARADGGSTTRLHGGGRIKSPPKDDAVRASAQPWLLLEVHNRNHGRRVALRRNFRAQARSNYRCVLHSSRCRCGSCSASC